jgi:predicted adenylyl cyclase CyaB
MPLEYEYRYQPSSFNKDDIRDKLKKAGAVRHGHWLFRVQVFSNPNVNNNPYIRVRDDGFQITMTYKVKGNKDFVNEQEVQINDFETGIKILLGLGCEKKYYYEKLREIWHIGNAEICFDTNPGRHDIMEVEAKTKKGLEKAVKLLGLENVPHDDFKDLELYEKPFGIVLPGSINMKFNTTQKSLGPLVTKSKNNFNKLVNEQTKMFNEVKKVTKKQINNKK